MSYTLQSEPPIAYHTWTAISVVAGALQRRCYLKWGFETLYPNLYIVLVGPSGRARKGVAMQIGKSLLKGVQGVTVTSENLTREALILAMKRSINQFEDPSDHAIKFHSSVTCFSEELSVFLGQNDIKFLASLTDWYDSHDDWTYETKGTGRDHLQGVCFNLLGATAPDWLQSMLPQEAVGGGFTSRVLFVVEETKGKTVAKPELTAEELELREALVWDLERISQLTGPYTFSSDGEAYYVSWYEKQDRDMAAGELPVSDPRFAGYCERRATHLRKISMALSASRSDSMKIEVEDLERALSLLRSTEAKMHKTFGGLGSAKHGPEMEKILSYIASVGTTTRSKLLAMFYRDVDSQTLKLLEETMASMKVVKITFTPDRSEVLYTWTGQPR